MISGLVLKDLNVECFVIRRGYETTLPVSSTFCLTVPKFGLQTKSARNGDYPRAVPMKNAWSQT